MRLLKNRLIRKDHIILVYKAMHKMLKSFKIHTFDYVKIYKVDCKKIYSLI